MWLAINLSDLEYCVKNNLLYFDYELLGSTVTHVTKPRAHAYCRL